MAGLGSWKNIAPESLHMPQGLEPSGIAIYTDGAGPWIFLASDDGRLAKARLDESRGGRPGDTRWRGPSPKHPASDKAFDYESVAFVGGHVMIGVEGDRPVEGATSVSDDTNDVTPPRILRFDQGEDGADDVGELTGSAWNLLDCLSGDGGRNGGMEGMTFIPDGRYPSAWAGSPHYGGVFLVSVQEVKRSIFVYALDEGDRREHDEKPVTIAPIAVPAPLACDDPKAPKISDLCFDPASDRLYVLYDGGAEDDYLQALSLSAGGTLHERWSFRIPGSVIGCEGVAVDGRDLYIAIDDNKKTGSNDGVYKLPGFLDAMADGDR